jgi:hypothetical protein
MGNEVHHGWVVKFIKNIHMYSHDLRVSKAGAEYQVMCEDTPYSFVGIWPYDLNLEESEYQDLLQGLRAWAKHKGFKYRLYTSREIYESNET